MKTYENVEIKRLIQSNLFKQLPPKYNTFIGLAGPNYLKYRKTILNNSNPRKIVLIDLNSNNTIVKKDNIENYLSNYMDLDFCSSIVNDGAKFKNVFYKMNNLKGDKYLFFTFSVRLKGGLNLTLEFLNKFIKFDVINTNSLISGKYGYPYCKELITNNSNVKLYSYKDTNCMISGLIKF